MSNTDLSDKYRFRWNDKENSLMIQYKEVKWEDVCNVLCIKDGVIELDGYVGSNPLIRSLYDIPLVRIRYGSVRRTVEYFLDLAHQAAKKLG